MTGANAYGHLAEYVPNDLASWTRKEPKDPGAPLRFHAEEGGQLKPDVTWPELGAAESGVVKAYGAVNGKSFIVLPIGILDHVVLEARSSLSLEVVDLSSGGVMSKHSLAASEKLTLGGAGARLLRGTLD
jgi:hypothetical protein